MIPTSSSKLSFELGALDPAWIVFEDESLLIVDKPEGVAAHAEDEGLADDLTSRVRAYLVGVEPAFHHRLDRETSGLVLITKTEDARRELARAFEQGEVRKRYIAGVRGVPRAPLNQGMLQHHLSKRSRGVVRIVQPKHGKEALTRVSLLEARGDRSLLSLEPLTGRTHQLRVQLAAIERPIAGDLLYGRDPAPRMLLHASELSFELGGERLRFRSDAPPSFERFLRGDDQYRLGDEVELRAALAAAIRRRGALFQSKDTSAFRLFHRERDGIPELAIDFYDGALVVHLYEEEGARPELSALLKVLAEYDPKAVFLKRRISRGHQPIAHEESELAPPEPLLGHADESPTSILEGGVRYAIDLSEGLSTGIFLDQRHSRALVRELSGGKRVLNLFSYTAPFTIAAIEGGASATLSIDASKPATRRAKESAASRTESREHRFIAEDVFEILPRLARREERFDLVIVDPPTHARTKRHRFNSGRDWVRLAGLCVPLIARGGALLASTNDHRASHAEFDAALFEAVERSGRRLIERRRVPLPLDFLPGAGAQAHLKVSLLKLD